DAFIRQLAGCEAEVNGEAALFFLGQRVGLAAGEHLHQRGLAVIHVPGGAEHDVSTRGIHGFRIVGADVRRAHPYTATVAQTSKSAVSRVSKPANCVIPNTSPTWKSAIRQVWKPALLPFSIRVFIPQFSPAPRQWPSPVRR